MTIDMQHNNLEGVELYCIERFIQIEPEGAAEHFFTATTPIDNEQQDNKV